MSIRTMSRVWEASGQRGSALLLLLAISDYADDNGVAWPAIDTLAQKIRINPRNTRRLIKSLQGAGEIKIIERPGLVNVYILTAGLTSEMERAGLARATAYGIVTPVTCDRGREVTGDRGGRSQVTPDPLLHVKTNTNVVVLPEEQKVAFDALQALGFKPASVARKYARIHPPAEVIGWVRFAQAEGMGAGFVRKALDAGDPAPIEREEAEPEEAAPAPAAMVTPEPPTPEETAAAEALGEWRQVLGALQLQMTKATFDAWLRGSRPSTWGNGQAVIGVRSPSGADWLNHRLKPTVERAAAQALGRPVSVAFEPIEH